jgi:hypothetical protein
MEPDKLFPFYKPGKELACPEAGHRQQVLLPENCFNPLIVRFRFGNPNLKINAKEENEKYFNPLSALRRAIEARPVDLKTVLETLWAFYDDIYILADKLEFQDFLRFEGLYAGCSWFKNSNIKDFPQDLICREENLPKKMKFDTFLEKGKRPKDLLMILFDGKQDIDTTKIGSLKFENPFSRILTGEFRSSEAEKIFRNAKDCLSDDAFKAQCRKGRGTKKAGAVIDDRIADGYKIPGYINPETIPQGKEVISSPTRYGVQGFANVVRGVPSDKKDNDFSKPVVAAAEKYLDETGAYLIHYDSTRKEYWAAVENKNLFERKKQGRRKRE